MKTSIIKQIGIDIGFAIILTFIAQFYQFIFMRDPLVKIMQNNTLDTIAPTTNVQAMTSQLYIFIAKWILMALLFLCITYIIFCITRALIWNIILKNKWSIKGTKLLVKSTILFILLAVIPLLAVLLLITFLQSVTIMVIKLKLIYFIYQLVGILAFFYVLHLFFIYNHEIVKKNSIRKGIDGVLKHAKQVKPFLKTYLIIIAVGWALFSGVGWILTYITIKLAINIIYLGLVQSVMAGVITTGMFAFMREEIKKKI